MDRVISSVQRVTIGAVGLFVALISILLLLQRFVPSAITGLQALGNIAGIATLLAVILGFYEYRRQLVFDRTEQAVKFMLEFYNNARLDPFRRSLRNRDETFTAFEEDGALKDMVVLGMNYLEALAIAVHEGVFHPALVQRMLGTVIMEVAEHPMSRELRENRFSYENFYELLVPLIAAEQEKPAKSGARASR